MNTYQLKSLACKGISLQRFLEDYNTGKNKSGTILKFKTVWGEQIGQHFLSKYDNAERLIWAFDNENLELFIEKF